MCTCVSRETWQSKEQKKNHLEKKNGTSAVYSAWVVACQRRLYSSKINRLWLCRSVLGAGARGGSRTAKR